MSSKSPTTPARLEQGIHDCIEKAGVRVDAIDAFVHGSTVAINTVLERKGARTAFVTRIASLVGTRDCAEAVAKLPGLAGPNVTGPFQTATGSNVKVTGGTATATLTL